MFVAAADDANALSFGGGREGGCRVECKQTGDESARPSDRESGEEARAPCEEESFRTAEAAAAAGGAPTGGGGPVECGEEVGAAVPAEGEGASCVIGLSAASCKGRGILSG